MPYIRGSESDIRQSMEGAMARRARVLLSFLFAGIALACLAAGTAQAQTVSVTTPLGGDPLTVEGFHGEEKTSSLFSFTLDFAAARTRPIPFDAILGQEVIVTVAQANGQVRYFNGFVSRLTAGSVDTRAHYSLDMAPRAWLLTRRRTSRIFQQQSVPQIAAQLLRSVPGLAFDLKLTGAYPARNYVVQRNESDFDFLSRLLEEEGIYYYFAHSATGHVMVLADTPQGAGDIPGVHVYRTPGLLPPPPGSVTAWEKSQEIRSGKVTLWDHSFETPGSNYEAQATIQPAVTAGGVEHHLAVGGGDGLELFDFPGGYAHHFDEVGPGGEAQPDELTKIQPEGDRFAVIRMQEEAAQALVIHGQSSAPDLAAGSLFALGGLVSQFNGKYFVTGVTHKYTPSGSTSGGYRNEFTCIPSGLPFRPPRTTPKPVLAGLETAVVVAPAGAEIFTDKYARVKVRFPWDRSDPAPGGASSSCWIRVGSPWAGAGSGPGGGSVIIPRVGWEVLVAFEEGDPDKPIIVGSVYNADHLPPFER
jgi:type VI secretion system secreted protein VgrG